ncbi:MAG: O-antigen ligase family protein [Terriglobia bacterium]
MPTAANNRGNRVALFFLFAFAAALPHSIAGAQTAAVLAALVWLVGLLVQRQRPLATPLDVPILLFLLVSGLAALFSLDPAASVTKLGSTALILIVPLTAGTIQTRRQALALVLVLLGSASVSAAVAVGEKIVGRGVEVVALAADSPFRRRVQPRDVILACDAQRIAGPAHFAQLLAAHNRTLPLVCQGLQGGMIPYTLKIPPRRLPEEASPGAWGYKVKPGRRIRARGTYSHFVTYAGVMLQLAALTIGLWLAYRRKWSPPGVGLALLAFLLVGTLAATFTRASWAALALAALAMVWMKVGWRGRIAAVLAALLALGGLNALLVRWRGTGFYNPADSSIQYRLAMWADGRRLIGEHPWLGVGMETVGNHWQELGVRTYERFGLRSHFHSTPIQLGVERGLLGLAAWLLLMGLYVRLLVRLVVRTGRRDDWWSRGLALGSFGATSGFLASSLVHYNFGDSEVVMVFWLLAGVAVALDRLTSAPENPSPS